MAINIAANTSKHLSVLLQCLHAYLMAQFTTIVIKTIMAVAVHDSRREFSVGVIILCLILLEESRLQS